MSLNKFIRIFYIFSFFCEFFLIYAVDKLYFLYRGLDLAQIAVLLAVMSMLVIILEVPTGAAADRWSCKNIIILSNLCRCVGFTIWIFSRNMFMFIPGTAFLVAGWTLESGTLQAYIFDFLKAKSKEEDFEKVWGRGFAIRLIGISIALALGGYLSTVSYELVVGLSAGFSLVATVFAFMLPGVDSRPAAGNNDYFTVLKNGIRKAFSNRLLLRVFIYSGIITAGFGIMDEYIPVLLSERLEMSNTAIGIWLAIGVGAGGIGSFYAHRLRGINWRILYLLPAVTGGLLFVIAFTQSPVIPVILVFFYVIVVLLYVLIEGIIQRNIVSEERATITSVNSFMEQAGAIIFGLAFGFIANRFGIQIGYGAYGVVFLVYVVVAVIRRGSRPAG